MKEARQILLVIGLFGLAYWLPVENTRVSGAIVEAFAMLHEYAREHVLLCLVPAFFIAGAISVFVSQAAVMKYLGAEAGKPLAYGVASVSGSILAACSCTVLPLFAGIYKRGAGLGPAIAFLYSGPAINVLAIILTARVLGPELGIARAVGAVLLSVVIGLGLHGIFRKEEKARAADGSVVLPEAVGGRALWKDAAYFAVMVGILVFANWAEPESAQGFWARVYSAKWIVTALFAAALTWMLIRWFSRAELGEWSSSTWLLAKQILPLLVLGVLAAGAILGRPGHEGLLRSEWIAGLVGGNSLWANLFASVAGALMYFATLTEVPILQGLMGAGMGKGPALALLLAGPALSLPNMLVIRSVLGTRKTAAYILLVVACSSTAGMIFGALSA